MIVKACDQHQNVPPFSALSWAFRASVWNSCDQCAVIDDED